MDEVFLYGGLAFAAVLLIAAVLMIFVFKIKKQKLDMQFLEEYGKDDISEGSQVPLINR